MSKQDRKEISTSTISSNTKDNLDQEVQINNEIFNRNVEENAQSLNQVFDESKKNIERNISEAKSLYFIVYPRNRALAAKTLHAKTSPNAARYSL